MRRASAISLLVAISFLLIAPAIFADPESNLPACCRRGGAHHCAMGMDDSASSTQPSLRSIQMKCPSFPMAPATPSGAFTAPEHRVTEFALAVSHPSNLFQTEAVYRISFSRSRQKRGPPAILS